MSGKSATKRTRNYTGLVYTESALPNWRDVMNEYHIPWVESPLHDKDTDEYGEIKKEHAHIAFCFEGVKSYEQAYEIYESLFQSGKAPGKIEPVHSMRALLRYFCHLDESDDKYKYQLSDMVAHNGADIASLMCPTRVERYEFIKEMIAYIRNNGVVEFSDFLDYSANERSEDWFPLLCDNSAYIIDRMIASERNKRSGGDENGNKN